jgi:WhiB family transcriptional regulator, redox-sensing transcriptional regulator
MDRVTLSPHRAPPKRDGDTDSTLWRQFAHCLDHDPDLWYPLEANAGAEAVRICSTCPVRLDCLAWALEHNEREGIWGGMSARRRQRLRSEARSGDGSVPLSFGIRPGQRAASG